MGISLGLSDHYKPNCQRYLANLMERDGFKKAMAHE
jgi:hypothetical protein